MLLILLSSSLRVELLLALILFLLFPCLIPTVVDFAVGVWVGCLVDLLPVLVVMWVVLVPTLFNASMLLLDFECHQVAALIPIDFVLNQLPKVIPRSPSKDFIDRWSAWWPVILSILLDIDRICHPDGGFAEDASDVSGRLFLNKLTLPNPSHWPKV